MLQDAHVTVVLRDDYELGNKLDVHDSLGTERSRSLRPFSLVDDRLDQLFVGWRYIHDDIDKVLDHTNVWKATHGKIWNMSHRHRPGPTILHTGAAGISASRG